MQSSSLVSLAMAVALSPYLAVFAERQVFTIVDGATDWTAPASYGRSEPGDIPSADDIVQVPNNATVTVADSASFALVSSLYAVCPLGADSVIVFDTGDDDYTVNALVTAQANTHDRSFANGTLVKKGWGTLVLGSTGQLTYGEALLDFGISYDVQKGELWISKEIELIDEVKHVPTMSRIQVAENARFTLGEGPGVKWNTVKWGIRGEGEIHCSGPMQLRIESDDSLDNACEFAGRFTEYIKYFSGGRVMLTGEDSAMTEAPSVYYGWLNHARGRGLTGVKKIGMADGSASSLGKATWFCTGDGGGGYLYLGSGETTDKLFRTSPYRHATLGEASSIFDAGATGGIVFNGRWYRTSEAMMGRLVIGGSNTVPCVVNGPFGYMTSSDGTQNGTPYTDHLTKIGSGTWRFNNHPSRQFRGTIAVEDGRLEYDTLYEKGEVCALGTSDLTTERYAGAWDANRTVDYAFSLGATAANSLLGEATAGTLAYVGTNPVMCLDRPILMAGDGCFENATTNRFRFRGITTEAGGGAKTLTIRTVATDENLIGDLYDRAADPLSLVKEGSGTWTLVNTNSIHGSIAVKEGMLVVKNIGNRKHSWFRVTIKGNHGNSKTTKIGEIGLFSGAEYNNINYTDRDDFPAIHPGEVAIARHMVQGRERFYGRASYLFTRQNYPDESEWDRLLDLYPNGTVRYNSPNAGTPASWMSFMARLPDAVGEIRYWDLGCVSGNADTCPSAASIEGSVDGVHWIMLEDAAEIPKATSDGTWCFYTGQRYVSWGIYGSDAAKRHAVPIRAFDTNTYDVFADVSSVSVGAGATLRGEGDKFTIRRLRIDASQNAAGSLENFILAEDGELEVVNSDGTGGALPIALSGVEGTAALGGWSLTVNGKADHFSRITSDGTGIALSFRKPPLTLMLR